MQTVAIAGFLTPLTSPIVWIARRAIFFGTPANKKDNKMKSISEKFAAVALFALPLLVMTVPAAKAEDYCITNGAQAAHGCGYPSMEMCRAASAGIGGMCALNSSSKSASDAMAYQPAQPQSRGKRKPATRH